MTYLEAIIYGAVQGIAEYLPISSSAHLILLPKFMGTKDLGLVFDVFLHLGTLLATVIYFWKDWLGVFSTLPDSIVRIVPGLRTWKKNRGLDQSRVISWKLIVIATVPALVAGGLLHSWISSTLRHNAVQAIALMAGGVILFWVDRVAKQDKNLFHSTPKMALFIGIAQCFALIPGVSRSGSTITGARLIGLDRQSAARFSFLISAPVTAAAVVFELRHFRELFVGDQSFLPILVAGISSFIFGILTIGGLLKLLQRFSFLSFALYRVVLGIVVLKLF